MKTPKFTTTSGRCRLWFGMLLVMLCGLNGLEAGQINELERSHRSKNSVLQNLLDHAVEAGLPGVSLRVMGPGVNFSGTAGLADLESAEPLTTEHAFFIASVTKTFTAVVALQLVNEGLLELDTPITAWLPPEISDQIPSAGQISLRQLLNHSSGLFDYLNEDQRWLEDFVADPSRQWTHADIIPYISGKPLAFPPGSSYKYSNTNYVLAGLIIETVTGQPYHLNVRQRIFDPLGLGNTYNGAETTGISGLVHGYFVDDEEHELADTFPWFHHHGLADAGIFSTPSDIAVFIKSLVDRNILLDEKMRELMMTPSGLGEPPSSYGLGIVNVPDFAGLGRMLFHNGRDPGYLAHMAYFIDKDTVIVLTANASYGEFNTLYDQLLNDIIERVLGNKKREPKRFSSQAAKH